MLLLLPFALLYTRLRYRWLARRIAREIADYRSGGYEVTAVIGVEGSPSCGVRRSLDLHRAARELIDLPVERIDRRNFHRAVLGGAAVHDSGMFVSAIRRALARRGIAIEIRSHEPGRA